ncbi:MAG: LL-diaminopimelate aminotransferase [bacterium]
MKITIAERLTQLPPYLFARIDALKEGAIKNGVDIIDLGIGDPDLPTPPHIREKMKQALEDRANHRYPSYHGMNSFRQAVALYYQSRFGVALDPDREVLSLIGSKEGIAHIPLAFLDPGDICLVPSPGYPVYQAGTTLAGGIAFPMPLLLGNQFLPDLNTLDGHQALKRAKLLFINYPNNPTAATADLDFFRQVVQFAKKHNLIVCHDAAYSEMTYDSYQSPSLLQAEEAREVGIEFHSLSKTYNMTGWRIGFAVGNPQIIAALGKVKTNIDSGIFQAIQIAGIEALTADQECVQKALAIYQERRDIFCQGLESLGLRVNKPLATFYLWIQVPEGFTSESFALQLLREAGIICTPGTGFGTYGEGFIRMALTVPKQRLIEVIDRMRKIL